MCFRDLSCFLPCKRGPGGIEIVTSGSHIKLDLIEFVQVTDYVHTKVGLQERASCIIPVTAGKEMR